MKIMLMAFCILATMSTNAMVDLLIREALHSETAKSLINSAIRQSPTAQHGIKYAKALVSEFDNSTRSKKNTKINTKINTNNKLIDRKVLFNKSQVQQICISPDGNRFAYIAKNSITGNNDNIHVESINNRNTIGSIIHDQNAIQQAFFVGTNSLVYIHIDDEHCKKITSVNLKTKDRSDLTPIENADTIYVITGTGNEFITISHTDGMYYIHKINPETEQIEQLKESETPIVALFDSKLQPRLGYKNIDQGYADIYATSTNQPQKIDHISMQTSKYISADRHYAYKLQEKNGKVFLCIIDLSTRQQQQVQIPQATSINDCQAKFDHAGRPLFVTVKQGRRSHAILDQSVKPHVQAISSKLKEYEWQCLDMAANGTAWIIGAYHPQKSTAYYVYTLQNKQLQLVTESNSAINRTKLPSTRIVNIRTHDNKNIYGYLTKPINSSSSTPLVILINPNDTTTYSWEYFPLAHLLVNRGVSVLSLNCREYFANQDIMSAVNWCLKNKVALQKKICISAKKNNSEAAAKFFLENQDILAGCILLSTNTAQQLLEYSDNIETPLLIMNAMTEETLDDDSNEIDQNIPITYVVYSHKISNELSAGVVEQFVSKIFNLQTQRITNKDCSKISAKIDNCDLLESNNNRGGKGLSLISVLDVL